MDSNSPDPLEYATQFKSSPNRKRWTAGNIAVKALLCGAVVALVITVLMPPLGLPRQFAQTVHCAANMREIGHALSIYAENNGDKYPDRLALLLATTELTPEALVCPTAGETRAKTSSSREETAANLDREPGHCSYFYLGAGKMSSESGETVLAFEPLGHHAPESKSDIDGSNVLFADGKVIYVPAADFKKLLAELNAGQNPSPTGKLIHDRG